MKNRVHKAQK